jgi:hypothetical protein
MVKQRPAGNQVPLVRVRRAFRTNRHHGVSGEWRDDRNAQAIKAHESLRTKKLSGRTDDEATLDEVERKAIRKRQLPAQRSLLRTDEIPRAPAQPSAWQTSPGHELDSQEAKERKGADLLFGATLRVNQPMEELVAAHTNR